MSSYGHYGPLDSQGCDQIDWRKGESTEQKGRVMEEVILSSENMVEKLLEQQEGKHCVGCDMKFPLYWDRRGEFWYHEDGAGGIICERHPDNAKYWRLRHLENI
jgi:hypothetical protein